MREWKERIIIPDMETVHVADGYDNPCNECEKWGEKCESCEVSVPLVADKWKEKEIIYRQDCICGIPVGFPYVVNN